MRVGVIEVDTGLLPVTTETAEARYRDIDAAYARCSIAPSSNLRPVWAITGVLNVGTGLV